MPNQSQLSIHLPHDQVYHWRKQNISFSLKKQHGELTSGFTYSPDKDDVSVIAVHTNMIIDTAPEYISSHYPDSNITFASDIAEEGYYSLLGGRGTYPYTVVIDENSAIVKIFFEALEYEDLEEVVESQHSTEKDHSDDDVTDKESGNTQIPVATLAEAEVESLEERITGRLRFAQQNGTQGRTQSQCVDRGKTQGNTHSH